MTGIVRFEDTESWKTARALAGYVYRLTGNNPFAKDYGLKDQIQRACVSIMSNIAEGFENRTDVQFLNYLGHAKGSAGEVRAQLYIALDLKYITQDQFEEAWKLAEKAARQLNRFMAYLEAHPRDTRIREEAVEYNVDG